MQYKLKTKMLFCEPSFVIRAGFTWRLSRSVALTLSQHIPTIEYIKHINMHVVVSIVLVIWKRMLQNY